MFAYPAANAGECSIRRIQPDGMEFTTAVEALRQCAARKSSSVIKEVERACRQIRYRDLTDEKKFDSLPVRICKNFAVINAAGNRMTTLIRSVPDPIAASGTTFREIGGPENLSV